MQGFESWLLGTGVSSKVYVVQCAMRITSDFRRPVQMISLPKQGLLPSSLGRVYTQEEPIQAI
jgi:hypothetical protein